MKVQILSISLVVLGLMAGTGQVQAHYSNGYHVLVDKDKLSQHHPESMAKGYIGGGKMITGHDHMGNPVIEACQPKFCQP